jgi:hypothetical protein
MHSLGGEPGWYSKRSHWVGVHVASGAATSFKLQLAARGYQVLFHADETNRCPGCGQSQWYVGRITAECAACGTAIAIAECAMAGFDPTGRRAVALHMIDGCGTRIEAREKRRERRKSAHGRTLVLHIDGSPRAFALENISTGGIMGEALSGITAAKSLVVELEDGTLLPAELRWSNDANAGLAFVQIP